MTELEDFAAWSKTGTRPGPITLIDYVGFVATPDLLFGFAALFSPDLVLHEGRRFLASGFSAQIYDQWVHTGRTPQEIQRVMNHVHIATILQHSLSDNLAMEAAQTLVGIWTRTLGPDGLTAEVIGRSGVDAAATFFEA